MRAYDVSRVPVREALKQLEVEGFVQSRAYAGVRVARMDADEAADLFAVRQHDRDDHREAVRPALPAQRPTTRRSWRSARASTSSSRPAAARSTARTGPACRR